MVRTSFLAVALALEPAFTFRSQRAKVGGVGKVDQLYTWGSPRTASPGLVKSLTDPCFPGYRVWNGRSIAGRGVQADQVPMLPAPAFYKHPMMNTWELDVTTKTGRILGCNAESQGTPWYRVGDMSLHQRLAYHDTAMAVDSWLGNMTEFCVYTAYYHDPVYVGQRLKALGWRLVGNSFHPGDTVGGPQVSYLMQKPDTLECLLTFQGTHSAGDVLQDANAFKGAFCGLIQEGETCGLIEDCKPKRAGDSFVHRGFRDHLMNIVKTDGWQKNIRPKLGKCSKVQVGGHSLGGALAELFTACNYRAPLPGKFGYEEYMWMNWTKSTPQLIPAV